VGVQQFLEEDRGGGEGADGANLQGGPPVESQHEFAHGDGQLGDTAVGAAVGFERARVDGVGECQGLAEGYGEAFAGDGVGRSGGIADQCDRTGGDAVQLAGCGDCAALAGDDLGVGEALGDARKFGEDVGAVATSVAGDVDNADAVVRNWGDVKLAAAAPVDFDEVQAASGRVDTVVGAESVADTAAAGAIEASPLAHRGGLAIGTDQPAKARGLSVDQCGVEAVVGAIGRELDAAVPEQARSCFLGSIGEQRVQMGAADSNACSAGEEGIDVVEGVLEADAAEEVAILLVEVDAELGEGLPRVGHQAFAAGLVDGVGTSLDDRAVDTALAQGDGGGKACGTSSDDQDINRLKLLDVIVPHRTEGTSVAVRRRVSGLTFDLTTSRTKETRPQELFDMIETKFRHTSESQVLDG